MKNSKIRIYELKYDLYDLVDRYQSKGIIFPSQNILQQHRQNITREAINALLYGIPYPQVYVSELQNGQGQIKELYGYGGLTITFFVLSVSSYYRMKIAIQRRIRMVMGTYEVCCERKVKK